MKKDKKLSVLRILMISSQLLLSLFLGYWLFSQYSDKRMLLSEELERGLRNSEQQVLDSLLSKHLINPILKDTATYSVFVADSISFCNSDKSGKMEMSMNMDSMPQMMLQLSGEHKNKILKSSKVAGGIELSDSAETGKPDIHSIIKIEAGQDSGKQVLFQSIKLLIRSVEKFDDNQNEIYTYFSSGVDSVLLVNIFKTFVDKEYNGFNVLWQAIESGNQTFFEDGNIAFDFKWQSKKENIVLGNKPKGIVISSNLFENLYGPVITAYQPYLYRAISPQITFAIVLLLITTLAFRMAFVNLKNQQKLISIKNNFISNISHELKTPVSTVKVALEALLDFNMKEDPTRTKDYLEMAHSEMNRLELLVNQVLNISVLDEGNGFDLFKEVNLTSIVNDVLYSMKSRFDKQNALIHFNPPKEEILIEGDKLHIHGIIQNLLDNSLKYTEQNPEIFIVISRTDQQINLIISDNGIGIPKEYRKKVFDKFFRVPKGDSHNVKGYGLGLNYAALVMKYHEGKIDIKSNDKGGSIFTLSFPDKQ